MAQGKETMFERIGRFLGRYLEFDRRDAQPYVSQDYDALVATIRVGDVLLVEGRAKISTGIKYLTQSTWSHAALCVRDTTSGGAPELVEVTLEDGCHRIPLSKYKGINTRLCRAASLSTEERRIVARFAEDRIGLQYDMRHIFDLMRYLIPTPPVPTRWRRRMLSFGSGDPTRAICSSLIAEAYQSIGYPILPDIRVEGGAGDLARREAYHIRNFALFTPRDFDLSPYFQVVKPTLENGFDYRAFAWAEEDSQGPAG
ncbi:MAG: lipo-like protein [Rhodobacteraceae bacterium]|nr:lipo-like protein [Paracoccaceae bacterium]